MSEAATNRCIFRPRPPVEFITFHPKEKALQPEGLLVRFTQKLPQLFHALLQHFPARPRDRFGQRGQWLVRHVQQIDETWAPWSSRRTHRSALPAFRAPRSAGDRLDPIGRIVLFLQLAQSQTRAIVHGHVDRRPASYSTSMSSKCGTKLISCSGSSWSFMYL